MKISEKENVVYVEIRTTPRRDVMSADEYVRAAVEGIIEYERNTSKVRMDIASCDQMTTARLLLSINRTATLEDAFDTVEVANKYFYKDRVEKENSEYNRVVGVELMETPQKANLRRFCQHSREQNLTAFQYPFIQARYLILMKFLISWSLPRSSRPCIVPWAGCYKLTFDEKSHSN